MELQKRILMAALVLGQTSITPGGMQSIVGSGIHIHMSPLSISISTCWLL
jgi:hypothetical protein